MAKEEVRLRYSGIILFLSRLLSIETGLIFALMITRNTTKEELGIYGNLGGTLSYFTMLATPILDNPLRSQRTCRISKNRTHRQSVESG